MPRNNVNPKRLSNAWKKLYKLKNLDLKTKISISKKLISKALEKSINPSVDFSGLRQWAPGIIVRK